MQEKRQFIDEFPVQTDLDGVLLQLGYTDVARVSARVLEKLRHEMDHAQRLIAPRGTYLELGEAPKHGFELFSPIQDIVLALATIGGALEGRSKQLVAEEQGAAGLILDAIGTVTVEHAADLLEQRIRRDFASSGWKVSRRYAPGHCGWTLRAQQEIFSHFPDSLGVSLTDSCLMTPEKSLSFICLLSADGDFNTIKLGNCRRCRQSPCPYRLAPYETGLG